MYNTNKHESLSNYQLFVNKSAGRQYKKPLESVSNYLESVSNYLESVSNYLGSVSNYLTVFVIKLLENKKNHVLNVAK